MEEWKAIRRPNINENGFSQTFYYFLIQFRSRIVKNKLS